MLNIKLGSRYPICNNDQKLFLKTKNDNHFIALSFKTYFVFSFSVFGKIHFSRYREKCDLIFGIKYFRFFFFSYIIGKY